MAKVGVSLLRTRVSFCLDRVLEGLELGTRASPAVEVGVENGWTVSPVTTISSSGPNSCKSMLLGGLHVSCYWHD